MKKEVGSIFPLSDSILKKAESDQKVFTKDRVYYSLCREALSDIAKALKETNRMVLIPAYTCQTVITPFEEAGWDCNYYSINKNLRIDTNRLLQNVEKIQPSLVVVHHFFGMDLNDDGVRALDSIKEIVIDIVM